MDTMPSFALAKYLVARVDGILISSHLSWREESEAKLKIFVVSLK